MGIDLSKNGYADLREHIGHAVVCVCYGKPHEDPHNVALECETCGCVLVDFDHPEMADDNLQNYTESDRRDEKHHGLVNQEGTGA